MENKRKKISSLSDGQNVSSLTWQKANELVGWACIAVLFWTIAVVGYKGINESDTPYHIKSGAYILQHGISTEEVFAFSFAGQPLVNHEWLYQVGLCLASRLFGPDGLVGVKAVLCLTIFVLLFLLGYRRDRQLALVFLLLNMLLISYTRSLIRPDIVSLLFIVTYVALLLTQLHRRWVLAAFIVMQVLWANIHGYFFMGPALAGLALLAEFLKRRARLPGSWGSEGRLDDVAYRRLIKICVGLVFACLVNPQFFAGAIYPIRVAMEYAGSEKYLLSYIGEFQRPFDPDNLLSLTNYPSYKVLFILSFSSFFLNRKRIDLRLLFFWIFFALYSVLAVRNLFFFTFIACLVTLKNSEGFHLEDILPIRFTDEQFKFVLAIVLKGAMILWLLSYGQKLLAEKYYDFDTLTYKTSYGKLSEKWFPAKAADFLVRNKIHGNFFNDYLCGDFLVARVYPDIRVYIHGRTEVFGAKFFRKYQQIYYLGDMRLFKKEAERLEITGVILTTSEGPLADRFLQGIYAQKDWRLVYFDDDATIFLKDVAANQEMIERYALDLSRWQTKVVDARQMIGVNAVPKPYYQRAQVLFWLGFDAQSLAEVNEAIRILPSYAPAYMLRGEIYQKRGEKARALNDYRTASIYDLKNKKIRLSIDSLENRASAKEVLPASDLVIKDFLLLPSKSSAALRPAGNAPVPADDVSPHGN